MPSLLSVSSQRLHKDVWPTFSFISYKRLKYIYIVDVGIADQKKAQKQGRDGGKKQFNTQLHPTYLYTSIITSASVVSPVYSDLQLYGQQWQGPQHNIINSEPESNSEATTSWWGGGKKWSHLSNTTARYLTKLSANHIHFSTWRGTTELNTFFALKYFWLKSYHSPSWA